MSPSSRVAAKRVSRSSGTRGTRRRGYLERSAVCAYAGIVADELINGRVTFGSGVDDDRRVREIAARLGVADVSEFLLAKRMEAREILRTNLRAVKEVKVALVERRTLSSRRGPGDRLGFRSNNGLTSRRGSCSSRQLCRDVA
jgi:hypothetical protein